MAEFDALGQGPSVSWYRWVAGVCIFTALTMSFYIVLDNSLLRAILAALSVVGFIAGGSWIWRARSETARARKEFNDNLISLNESLNKEPRILIPLPKAEFDPTYLSLPVISQDDESFEVLVRYGDEFRQLEEFAESRDPGVARLLHQIARQLNYRADLGIRARDLGSIIAPPRRIDSQ